MSPRFVPTPVLGAVEIALNRYLAGDSRARKRCAELAGRVLTLDLSDLGLTLTFVAERHGMQLRGDYAQPADVRLTGASTAFGRIALSGGRDGLTGAGLRIEGDVGIAQRFADLLSDVDFDIGDIIDARFGPVAAYFAGRGLRGARAILARAARQLPEQTAEYLREETFDVIGAFEHDKFVAEVDGLRADTDRLAARLRRLG